jgi:hypothetical protein
LESTTIIDLRDQYSILDTFRTTNIRGTGQQKHGRIPVPVIVVVPEMEPAEAEGIKASQVGADRRDHGPCLSQ